MTRIELVQLLNSFTPGTMPVVIDIGNGFFACIEDAVKTKKFHHDGNYKDKGRATDEIVDVIQINLKEQVK